METIRFRIAVITADDELWSSTVRRLEEHDLAAERLSSPLDPEGRKRADRADAVLVDGRDVDVPAAIEAWLRAGWIDRTCPIMVVSPDPPEREKHLAWLRGGAWGVVRTPVDAEMLTVQLETLVRSARSDAEGRPAPPRTCYDWTTFLRAVGETIGLAERYGRDLCCVAIAPDWSDPDASPAAYDLARRLSRPAQLAVRRYDLVGVSRAGALLIIMPDTEAEGAETFRARMVPVLEGHLRTWGVVGRLRSGVTALGGDPPTDAAEFLLEAARNAR